MALIDDIKVRFPDLDPVCVDKYYSALSFSDADFWKCWFCFDYIQGDCNAEKILNLVAHLITIEASGTEVQKDIASTSVGGVSESYVDHGGFKGEFKEFFNSTVYGQRFLTLLSSVGGAFFV